MPDNDQLEPPVSNSNMADVLREAIRAVRDILNDWRVATALLVLILLLAGRIAHDQLFNGMEQLIRAWRCQ